RNHAAERSARTRGHIGSEAKTVRAEKVVQLVQDHTRPDPHHAAFDVQVCDFTVIARKINDETITDRASHQTGAGAPRNDRYARLARRLDDGAGLPRVAREGDRDRLDLIDGGVGGVELARQIIEGDFTV